mmetsp:Transcript_12996/g.47494  ORF Transcript_12996/g.47494 Transcript_12996/m.47494 type:complete len:84 (+) Transcript_12996:130-381(+)
MIPHPRGNALNSNKWSQVVPSCTSSRLQTCTGREEDLEAGKHNAAHDGFRLAAQRNCSTVGITCRKPLCLYHERLRIAGPMAI